MLLLLLPVRTLVDVVVVDGKRVGKAKRNGLDQHHTMMLADSKRVLSATVEERIFDAEPAVQNVTPVKFYRSVPSKCAMLDYNLVRSAIQANVPHVLDHDNQQ